MAIIPAIGCGPSASTEIAEVEEIIRSLDEPGPSADGSESLHDFGTILARGQTLHHEFSLSNPSDRPFRVLGTEARTPCCSAIGKLPDLVAPGRDVQVPVSLKVGHDSGWKRVEFAVRTDDAINRVKVFALVASLVAEVETRLVEGSASSLLTGESGEQTLLVICRRKDGKGRPAPVQCSTESSLKAEFTGPAEERGLPDGTIEASRRVRITLPAGTDEGDRRADLILTWQDGRVQVIPLAWKVTPHIIATPGVLVLKSAEPTAVRTIRLRSLDDPFRILGLRGGILFGPGDWSRGKDEVHEVRVTLARDAVDLGTDLDDLIIDTDHPRQPKVAIKVMTLTTN